VRAGLPIMLAAVALAAAGPAAVADTACRPDALGQVLCRDIVPPPKPRPVYRSDTQALERVQEPVRSTPKDDFIPARRTRGLGTILPDSPAGPGLCRADALGNLVCR
jgi:hypothetical protein